MIAASVRSLQQHVERTGVEGRQATASCYLLGCIPVKTT